jgi:bacteriocin-like protein
MRKLKTNNRLVFSKAAVTELNNSQLKQVNGGTASMIPHIDLSTLYYSGGEDGHMVTRVQ